ncbi:MAG: hypothetical protein ACOC1K_06655 [Nanoarchaeota archaeon]
MSDIISKEFLEKELGCKISYFSVEPVFNRNLFIGLNIKVVPEQKIEQIKCSFKIEK